MTGTLCPCGLGRPLAECCGPLLSGVRTADSPAALMRSRYVAFCTQNFSYIWATTDPETLAGFDKKSNEAWGRAARFTRLEILNSTEVGNLGSVEFKAYFILNDRNELHHEHSTFRKHQGRWYFRSEE